MDISLQSLPISGVMAGRNEAVLTSELSQEEGRAYDQFVATAPSGHFNQTRAWAAVATIGKPFKPLYFIAFRQGRVIGACLVLRTVHFGVPLPLAQVERGPVCASPEDVPEVVAALRRCCLARGIIRLAVMPYWAGLDRACVEGKLVMAGFKDQQHFAGRHARTLRLDLPTLDEKKPWNTSSLSKIRHEISRAARAGATARPGCRDDLAAFQKMQAEQLAQEGRTPPGAAWYAALGDYFLRPQAAMYVSEFDGTVISALFVALHNGVATYVMGASSSHRLKFSKTVLPLSDAILWARSVGAHTFDMGGIPLDGDTDPKRQSIAKFKYSYSGNVVCLVHEHVRWF